MMMSTLSVPSEVMSRVEQFLQNGTLPFIGREKESRQIVELWRGSVDAGRLRGMVLTAEAGAGKSRLLEEVIAQVREEGGVVIHAKLYPEAANDLAQVVRGAIDRDRLSDGPEERSDAGDINQVVDHLRHLSRVRRTFLIIEDIHLLPSEAQPDLDIFLRGLADETLSFLVATRPVQLASRAIIEPFVVANLQLSGLTRQEIGRLWTETFGIDPGRGVAEVLEKVTLGIPLALRSAFRGGLQAGSIQDRRQSSQWSLSVPLPLFEQTLHQSVSVIVEGLVSGLTRELRESIASIATLGEVFARESAEKMVSEPEEIDRLIEAGLLIQAGHLVAPLAGLVEKSEEQTRPGPSFPSTRFPLLAFTHSLVQNQLAAESRAGTIALFEILAENMPLYSLAPFTLLADRGVPEEVGGIDLANAVSRVTNIAQSLDRTSSWKEGERIWEVVRTLQEGLRGRIPDQAMSEAAIRHAVNTLAMHGRRKMGTEKWKAALDEVERLTDAERSAVPLSRDAAYARIFLASHSLVYFGCRSDEHAVLARTDAIIDEVLTLYPDYRLSSGYAYYLNAVGGVSIHTGSRLIAESLRQRVDRLLADDGLPDHMRTFIKKNPMRYLLQGFQSERELEESYALLEMIQQTYDQQIDADESYFDVVRGEFLMTAGRFAEAAELAERVASTRRDLGLWISYLGCRGLELTARMAFDDDRRLVEKAVEVAGSRLPGVEDRVVMEAGANIIKDAAILRGNSGLIRMFEEAASIEVERSESDVLALWNGDLEKTQAFLDQHRPDEHRGMSTQVWRAWQRIAGVDAALPAEEDAEVITPQEILERPHLKVNHLLENSGTIHLLLMTGAIEREEGLRERAVAACVSGLEWVLDHGGPWFATTLIDLLRQLGEADEADEWEGRVEEFKSNASNSVEKGSAEKESTGEKLRLSMLGKIRIALPGEEYASVRGIRIRTILGLMVADAMLERPLSVQEFTHLAGGSDPDPEHARKKKNMGVVRLREIMGRDAILTDGDRPRLNDELVTVDLLEADRQMRDAGHLLAEGSVVRALPLLEETLDLLGGEVPFPTLYDEFFENLRSDVDRRLQALLTATVHALLEGGESSRAIDLIHRGLEVVPGDEELGEMLVTARSG